MKAAAEGVQRAIEKTAAEVDAARTEGSAEVIVQFVLSWG
jgi:hypothetical protein